MAEYFIRWRGAVSGPFSLEAVRNLAQSGKLSRHHHVSTDQQVWQPLANSREFREVFAPPAPPPTGTAGNSAPASGAASPQPLKRAQPMPHPAVTPLTGQSTATDTGRQAVPSRTVVAPGAAPAAPIASEGPLWFYLEEETPRGPVTEAELWSYIQRGLLRHDSLVCRSGEGQWHRVQTIVTMLAASHGAGVDPGYGVSASEAPMNGTPYAGFWRRFLAVLLDLMILTVLCMALGFVVGFVLGALRAAGQLGVWTLPEFRLLVGCTCFVIGQTINWLYFTCLESGQRQATLGKRALDIRVTDLAGNQISWGRANGRYWAKIISGTIFLIGYLMVPFTDRKQALHDLLAGTLVLQKG